MGHLVLVLAVLPEALPPFNSTFSGNFANGLKVERNILTDPGGRGLLLNDSLLDSDSSLSNALDRSVFKNLDLNGCPKVKLELLELSSMMKMMMMTNTRQ